MTGPLPIAGGVPPASADGDAEAVAAASDTPALHLALDGWEGPLDLLLDLARRQKVDLLRISILELVDQYLAFVARVGATLGAGAARLERAADYLVMAAWLAHLKSALLLPRVPGEEPSAQELAARLQLRLARLAAMREAAARLLARDRLGRDVFARGAPEGLRVDRRSAWQCDWYALVAAYGGVRARTAPVTHVVRVRGVMTLEDALARVSAMLGTTLDWIELAAFVPPSDPGKGPRHHRSALASSFVAALELARLGRAELAQDEAFGPLRLRARMP